MSKVNYQLLNPANISYSAPRNNTDFINAVSLETVPFRYFNASLAVWITNGTDGYIGIKAQLIYNQTIAIAPAQQIARFNTIQYIHSDTFDDGTSLIACSKRVPFKNESSILITYVNHEKPKVIHIYPSYDGRFSLTAIPDSKSFAISYLANRTSLVLRQYTINSTNSILAHNKAYAINASNTNGIQNKTYSAVVINNIGIQNRTFVLNQDPQNVDFYLASFRNQAIYFIWAQKNNTDINIEKMSYDINSYLAYKINANPENLLFDQLRSNNQEKIALAWKNINPDNTTHHHLITLDEQYIINNQKIHSNNTTELLSITVLDNSQVFCIFKTNNTLSQRIILPNSTTLESVVSSAITENRHMAIQNTGSVSDCGTTTTVVKEDTTGEVQAPSNERPVYSVFKDGNQVTRGENGVLVLGKKNHKPFYGTGTRSGGTQIAPEDLLGRDQHLQSLLRNIQARDIQAAEAEARQAEELKLAAEQAATERRAEAEAKARRVQNLLSNAPQHEREIATLEQQYAEEAKQAAEKAALEKRRIEAEKIAQRSRLFRNSEKADRELDILTQAENEKEALLTQQRTEEKAKYYEMVRAQTRNALERRLATATENQNSELLTKTEIDAGRATENVRHATSSRLTTTKEGIKRFVGEGRVLGGRKPLPSETITEARQASLHLRNEVLEEQHVIEQKLQEAKIAEENARTAEYETRRKKIEEAILARIDTATSAQVETISQQVATEITGSLEIRDARTAIDDTMTTREALALEAQETREIAVEEAESTQELIEQNIPIDTRTFISREEPVHDEEIQYDSPGDSRSSRKTKPKALVHIASFSVNKNQPATSPQSPNDCQTETLTYKTTSLWKLGSAAKDIKSPKVLRLSKTSKSIIYLAHYQDHIDLITEISGTIRTINSQKYLPTVALHRNTNALYTSVYSYYNLTTLSYQYNLHTNNGNHTNLFKMPKPYKGVFASDTTGSHIITASMSNSTHMRIRKLDISNPLQDSFNVPQQQSCQGYPTLFNLKTAGTFFVLVYGSPANEVINIQCRDINSGNITAHSQISEKFSKIKLDVYNTTTTTEFAIAWQNTYSSDIDILDPAKLQKFNSQCSKVGSELTLSSKFSTREELHSVKIIDNNFIIAAFAKSHNLLIRAFKDSEVWQTISNPNREFIGKPDDIEINYVSNFTSNSPTPQNCERADIFVSYSAELFGESSIHEDQYQLTRDIP
jgi:hypothetical protein